MTKESKEEFITKAAFHLSQELVYRNDETAIVPSKILEIILDEYANKFKPHSMKEEIKEMKTAMEEHIEDMRNFLKSITNTNNPEIVSAIEWAISNAKVHADIQLKPLPAKAEGLDWDKIEDEYNEYADLANSKVDGYPATFITWLKQTYPPPFKGKVIAEEEIEKMGFNWFVKADKQKTIFDKGWIYIYVAGFRKCQSLQAEGEKQEKEL